MSATVKVRPLCRHCRKVQANRPRDLCWSCYHDEGVRGRYPSLSKYARAGVADYYGRDRPAEPTDATPGSEEKLRVLIERASLGLALFHPQDAALTDDVTVPARLLPDDWLYVGLNAMIDEGR